MLFSIAAAGLFIAQGAILCRADGKVGQFFPPEIQNSWGPLSPYFPAKPYTIPPSNCEVTQVNLLHRHGARFPTSNATGPIKAALSKLQSATQFLDPKLNFVSNFTYILGEEDLVSLGALQSEQSGRETVFRYPKLVSAENIPFVRASSRQRVIDSATNWTAGFSLASNEVSNPVLSIILSEKLNDTLWDFMCPNRDLSVPQTLVWLSLFGDPIAARLNAQATGANLNATDVHSLITLCASETVAKQVPSPFCALFSPAEFVQFEYFVDLEKFYRNGDGQVLGRVQGVGYVNELLARLTGTPVTDKTQTNRTLDASPTTFPLNRTLYVDFSHENVMVAIYATMGLFKQPAPLDPTKPDPKRTYITSQLMPFSARMVTERLSCTVTNQNRNGSPPEPQTYVRVLVNDALQPLEFCGANKDGLCTLSKFVESQSYSRNNGEGDFEKCGFKSSLMRSGDGTVKHLPMQTIFVFLFFSIYLFSLSSFSLLVPL